VVQVPASIGATAMGFALESLIWTVAGLFVAIGLLAMVFAYRYLKPLTDLAKEAAQIANGEAVFPSEATRTYEAAQLSSALVRLQVNMLKAAPE
jgi:nitrogen fixation/metabolism regulation signal transduction histidine kinase